MKNFSFLRSADAVTIIFVLFLTVLEIFFFSRIPGGSIYIVSNLAIIVCVYACAKHISEKKEKSNAVIRVFRDWYLVPAILFIYTQASSISHPINQTDYDSVLIAIDLKIFGVNPTQWIYQFANPLLTEILQISYSSYYLFFVFLFYELYKKNMMQEFEEGGLLIVYGFYLSYVGYLLIPAVGPRFTLHDFHSLNTELPGLFLTPYLREIINSGGGVIAEGDLLQFVHRDVFPSGHTQLTLTAMYIAFSNRVSIRWGLLGVGSLLIISTIYMRYHYVIDVAAGFVFFVFAVWSGKKIHRWWIQR